MFNSYLAASFIFLFRSWIYSGRHTIGPLPFFLLVSIRLIVKHDLLTRAQPHARLIGPTPWPFIRIGQAPATDTTTSLFQPLVYSTNGHDFTSQPV
jgi:hypothetical protein